ncbi:hypothetical protein KHA80_13755 [Anaerobacillus sp. HL2]|nr:hypothetical protein KHA80_13755 [Anaerobacillus sp. HL2]
MGGHTIDDTPKYGLAVTGNIPEGKTFISKEGTCYPSYETIGSEYIRLPLIMG